MKEAINGQTFDRHGICTDPRRTRVYYKSMTPMRLTILTALNPDDGTWHYGYEFQSGTFLTSHLVRAERFGGCQTEAEAEVRAFDLIRTELAIRGHAKDFITSTCLREARMAEREAVSTYAKLKLEQE